MKNETTVRENRLLESNAYAPLKSTTKSPQTLDLKNKQN